MRRLLQRRVAAGAATGLVVALALAGTAAIAGADSRQDLTAQIPGNPFAYIPPQCYTRTQAASGAVSNPCYTCHVNGAQPNFARDGDLQLAYDFPAPALTNRWTNLFTDRRAAIAATADADILAYVRTDNYHAADGAITLDARLDHPPVGWDVNHDGAWSGFRPDIAFRFDRDGYDVAPDGRRTGWRAYGYHPLAGAFLPTNGSADDVAIRLPAVFRENRQGRTDWTVYRVNLAIVEALIKRADVAIAPVDERPLGVDLDRDGQLSRASRVAFAFDPRQGTTMHYAGRAGSELAVGRLHLAAGLYPVGTEFVHSLRYLDVDPTGAVRPAARMKELRYARKVAWRSYASLLEQAMNDLREEHDAPERPERFFGDVESGVSTGQGWRYQGFIEDARGELRPQTFEESLTCAGCHAGIGRTVDSTFSFARKVDGPDSWYHWNADRSVGALPDRIRADGRGDYATYLARNHAGDEFRANAEVIGRFFPDGALDKAAVERLKAHVADFTDPSPGRALALDKAYRLIVREQSYAAGRTPALAPLDATVRRSVAPAEPTGIERVVD